jgi:MFS family permease
MDLMLGGRGNIMIPSSENNNNDVKARTPTPHHSASPIPMRIIPKTLQPSSPSTKIPASAWKVLAILSCIATMVMYAETMLIPAIPDLIKDFNVSYSTSAWILTTYLLVGAVMTPISGKLSDIYGKKKMLLIIMIFYLVGVSIAGFATSIYFLIIARAIQGIGMSMFPIAFSIIRDQFPREKISIGQGVITSMFASGAVIGLSVGGTIIKHYGWEATFFSIIPVAIALLIIIWRFIHVDEGKTLTPQLQQPQQPEQLEHDNPRQNQEEKEQAKSQQTERRISSSQKGDNNSMISKSDKNTTIDIKGAITLAITVTSFLLVLTFMETGNSNTAGSSAQIFVFLIVGVISFILFIMVERKNPSPLVDLKLMLHKTILPANLMIMIIGFSMFMVFQTIPILVRNPPPLGFGEDAVNTGNVQLPFALVLLVFGPTSGFIISKLGSVKPIIAGTIITASGFLGLLIFHSSEILVSANLAILSTGLSLTSVGAMNVIILSTPRQYSGISLGMSSLMRIVGASIGPALAGMYMQTHQSILNLDGIVQSFPSAESYNLIFLTAFILSVASVALAVLLRRRVIKMAIPNVA